jgi:hypothetical protein
MEINGQRYFDGGMNSNNPILEVIDEAYLLYGRSATFDVVLSIGTGATELSSMGRGIQGFLKTVIERVTNTEAKHQECQKRFPGIPYFRLNDEKELASIDLADYTKLKDIEQTAKEYIRSAEGRTKIMECASRLKKT